MNQFPKATAAVLEQLATAYAWQAANERAGLKKDAERDKNNVAAYGRDLATALSQHGISKDAAKFIGDVLCFTAWHAANERYGYKQDAARDDMQAKEATTKLTSTGAVSPTLSGRIRELGLAYGWHAANTRKGFNQDAANDEKRAKTIMVQIAADHVQPTILPQHVPAAGHRRTHSRSSSDSD